MTQIFDVKNEISEEALKAAISALQKGDLIIHPTDTIFGIGADAENPKALQKVSQLKSRDPKKSFIITFPSLQKVETNFTLTDSEKLLAQKFWPGALTLILDNQAVRVPGDRFSQTLLQAFKKPLISTSANLSNKPTVTSGPEAQEFFQGKAAIIWDAPISPSLPSTIIKFENNQPQILRQGAISKTEIMKILS